MKRIGRIFIDNYNMTKEIEETVLSDANQMTILYEKIDELKKDVQEKDELIKEKDIKIKNLTDENEALKLKVITFEKLIDYKNEVNPIETDEYKNLQKEIKLIKEQHNQLLQDKKELQADYINIQKKQIDHNDLDEKYKQLLDEKQRNNDIKDELEQKVKDLQEKVDKQSKVTEIPDDIKKNFIDQVKHDLKKDFEKDLNDKQKIIDELKEKIKKEKKMSKNDKPPESDVPIKMLDKFPVKVYNINSNTNNNELLEFISTECCMNIHFNSIIGSKMEKINKTHLDDNLMDPLWEDIWKFKVENGELKDTDSNKKRTKNKITRCRYLFSNYSDNLCKFKIPMSYLGDMTKKEWNLWCSEFAELFENTFKDATLCDHIYPNKMPCITYNCKKKHRKI